MSKAVIEWRFKSCGMWRSVYWYTVNGVTKEVAISIFKVIQKDSASQKRGVQTLCNGLGFKWDTHWGVTRIGCIPIHSPLRSPKLSFLYKINTFPNESLFLDYAVGGGKKYLRNGRHCCTEIHGVVYQKTKSSSTPLYELWTNHRNRKHQEYDFIPNAFARVSTCL